VDDPEFRRDLHQGTASYYDRLRGPYPRSLIDDLAERTEADSSGRLLHLACGTGQISFALQDRFAENGAVDQVMAPTSRRPWTRYGPVGLLRGERSRRKVPGIATRAAFKRAAPSLAISGAPTSFPAWHATYSYGARAVHARSYRIACRSFWFASILQRQVVGLHRAASRDGITVRDRDNQEERARSRHSAWMLA
jgi:hypothetical protein